MITEAATSEPISLEQVKTYLRIDGNALDDDLRLMIAAVREDLELVTGLRLMDQVVRVQASQLSDLDHLTVGPVREIVAVGSIAPGGALAPVSIDLFELTGQDLDRGIAPARPGALGLARRPIYVDLRVGYGADSANVPASLRLALLAMIRGRHDDRPADVERLIFNYRINA